MRGSRNGVTSLERSRCLETLFTGGDAAWSADGRTLFAARNQIVMAIRVDDPLNSWELGSEAEGLKVSALCLDDSSARLAVAYTNGLLREWEVDGETGRESRCWRSTHSAAVLALAYSSDSAFLATGSADTSVLVWEVRERRLVHKLRGSSSVVSALAFVSSSLLVVGRADGSVQFFSLHSQDGVELLHDLKLHSSRVTRLVLNENGDVIVSSRDHTCSVIDAKSGQRKRTVALFEAVESVVAVPDERLFSVGEEGTLKEWNSANSRLLRSSRLTSQVLEGLFYNSLRNELLVLTADHNLLFIDVETLSVKKEIVGFHDEVFSVALLGEAEQFLVVAANSPELRLYDVASFTCRLVPGHSASVVSVAVPSWDSSLLASCSKDNSIALWRLASSSAAGHGLFPLAIASGHTGSPSSLSFSAVSSRGFLLSVGADSMLKLWNMTHLPQKPVATLQEAPHLSCASTLHAHSKDATCVDVSPSNVMAVTGGMDKTAKLWTVDSVKMQLGIIGNLPLHRRGVWDAKFSPNGQKVATCGGDCLLRVFSVSDRSTLAVLEGHSSAVLKILFVNNGAQLMSVDSGGILKVWGVASGVCENSIEAHSDKVWSLISTKDESTYVTAGSDGRLIMWMDTSEEVAEKEREKQAERLQQAQTLENILSSGRYADALEYALSLDRPLSALKVVERLSEKGELPQLQSALLRLSPSQLITFLQFAARWNTNCRSAHAAQISLSAVLACISPDDLLALPNIGSVIFDFLPYTKRHFERVARARQNVSLVSFAWSQMRPAS